VTISLDTFLDQSQTATSVKTLFNIYQKLLGALGFDRVCYAFNSNHPTLIGEHELGVIYANNMRDWVEHYAENQYANIDPLHKHALTSPGIEVWEDWATRANLSASELDIFAQAKHFGLHNGITAFIHGAGGTKSSILMASSDASAGEQDKRSLDAIFLASYQFHNCYLDLMKYEFDISGAILSTREESVLKYMAQGYTKAEVSKSLNMSSHTVDYHVRNILRKLNAKNSVAATAIAIQQNYIFL